MSHLIRKLEHNDIEIEDLPGADQISPQAARDIMDLAARYGCTRDGEWFTYKRNNAKKLK